MKNMWYNTASLELRTVLYSTVYPYARYILLTTNIASFPNSYTVGMPCTCIGVGWWIFIRFKALIIARGNFISCKGLPNIKISQVVCHLCWYSKVNSPK